MGAVIGRRKPTVLVLGLDNSGKTTIVNCLMRPTGCYNRAVVPSVGVTVQRIQVNSIEMTICDVSGLYLIIFTDKIFYT